MSATWLRLNLGDRVDDEISNYFRSIGFQVTWDFNRTARKEWYEIMDDGVTILQIDFTATLDSIKEDFPLLAQGLPGTSNVDWEVRGTDEAIQHVVARMFGGN